MGGGHYALEPSHATACIALCTHLVPNYVCQLGLFIYISILPQPHPQPHVFPLSPLKVIFSTRQASTPCGPFNHLNPLVLLFSLVEIIISKMSPSPYSNDQYTIGWISALNEEFMVAMAMLDQEHGRPQSTPQEDTNVYHLGRIGDHNVAMACLSGGQMGTGPAAIVAENMRRTFKSIRFALLVGVGGGVPGKGKDIRLGDVVVSYPSGTYTGVVQHDYGKLKGNGHIQRLFFWPVLTFT